MDRDWRTEIESLNTLLAAYKADVKRLNDHYSALEKSTDFWEAECKKRDAVIARAAEIIDGMLTWKDCDPGLVRAFTEWLELPEVIAARQKKSQT